MTGPFQYFLVSVMTCSALAAIMSTADSALMGVSSVVSIDILQGTLIPSMTNETVVRVGVMSSFFTCAVAFFMGTFLSSDQMGAIIVFQNGMLLQLLPAFGIGLYTKVSERSVSSGIIVGLLSLLLLVIFGNPLDEYVPDINVSAFLNFLTVALVHFLIPGSSGKELLDITKVRSYMATSREPSLVLLLLMFAIALVSAPWYSTPGEKDPMFWGIPRWGCVQLGAFVVIFAIGAIAVVRWKPPPEARQETHAPGEKVDGVAAAQIEADVADSVAKC